MRGRDGLPLLVLPAVVAGVGRCGAAGSGGGVIVLLLVSASPLLSGLLLSP